MYLMQTVSASPRGRPASGMEPRPGEKANQILNTSAIEDYRNYRNLSYDQRLPQGDVIKVNQEKRRSDAENEGEREKKKEKKWTLGGFFRRKNKKELEDSTDEEEDNKKGFLNHRRSSRSKRKSRTNGFDVVVPQYIANSNLGKTAEELWSGPKEPQQQRYIFRQHDVRLESNLSRNSSGGSGSLDSRKGRREVMARAQAKRDQMRDGSSSDENGSGQSSSSVTREGRRRRPGRPKIPSATPSPSRSPRVQPKMPLHGSSSYPMPVHTYPPGYHWEVPVSPHRRTLHEYEQFLAACGTRNKSMSYDHDMHRAEAMFVQLPIARTRSSCIQAEAHGEVPNLKPEPPPRMRPITSRVDSTSSLPIQHNQVIQRSSSGNYFGKMYENVQEPYHGSYPHIYQNYRHPNEVTKTTVQYSQSAPKPIYNSNTHNPPKIPSSPPADLRYYADQNPRSRNPIHITCSTNPSPTSDPSCFSDSQISRRSTKEFWRQKDKEVMMQQKQQLGSTSKTDRSRSNSPPLTGVASKSKPRQTAVVVARKVIHGVTNNYEPAKTPSQLLPTIKTDEVVSLKTPPNPPIRRYSKIETPVFLRSVEASDKPTSNLDDALNELESIYKSLRLSEDYGTPVKSKMSPPRFPDKVADDMAVRRLTVKDCVDNKKLVQQSYLQCSPVLGSTPRNSPIPPLLAPAKPSNPGEPDVTLDDVVFRNHRHANNFLKTPDPQPPFGIPIGPVTPAANSDYLHINPTDKLRNSFIASKVPDIVKDDLAFRNLRKDNLTANLPPSSQVNSGVPKKRAVRSLSENLSNLLQKNESAFLPIETNNNVVENNYDKTQSMTDLNKNIQRDCSVLEKRLKALKEEKLTKRAEFLEDKHKTPVTSMIELGRSSTSVDNIRQRSTSTETLTEDPEMKMIREGMQKKSIQPPAAPERRHFRSPVVELSKYPAAVPATALQQTPFKEEPVSLDDIQLDDLLSKIACEAKKTSEAIGRQLVELEVAVASDMLSPERKPSGSRLSSIENEMKRKGPVERNELTTHLDIHKNECGNKGIKNETLIVEKASVSHSAPSNNEPPSKKSPAKVAETKHESHKPLIYQVEVLQVEVQPPPTTHKASISSNLSKILQEVEKEHIALCKAFPETTNKKSHIQPTSVVEEKGSSSSQILYDEVKPVVSKKISPDSRQREATEEIQKSEGTNEQKMFSEIPGQSKTPSNLTVQRPTPDKPSFEPISDLSEIMDSEDINEFSVPDDKIDVFEEVYEYNCALFNVTPPQTKLHDSAEISVKDELKRILDNRTPSRDEIETGSGCRGEESRSRGAAPGGPGEVTKTRSLDDHLFVACSYALALLPMIEQLDFLTALGIVLAVVSIFALLML